METARTAGSTEEIHVLCSELCDAAGFDYFIYGVDFRAPRVRSQIAIVSGFPSNWWQYYQERGYISIDPVVRHTMERKLTPLIWNDIDPQQSPQSERVARFMSEARDFGLTSGVSFPVQGLNGESAIFSLVSRDSHVRAATRIAGILPAGQLLTAYIHEAAQRVFEIA